jgi:uncharacterized protein YciI
MRLTLVFLCWLASCAASAQDFTFVFLHKKADKAQLPKEEVDKIMEGHMANINRLAQEGKLIAAGPFDGGGGIFIFKSKFKEEVSLWLQDDPGIRAQRWDVEMLPYEPRTGGVCAVSEPYEMTSYHLIHYRPSVMKFNVQTADESVKKHEGFIQSLARSGNVITYGSFGGLDGGILVMKGDLQQDVIQGDPAVSDGVFTLDFKKLWIAKGAFCEK